MPFTTIIRNKAITLIIQKRPAKKGLFEYIPMSDIKDIDELLEDSINIDQFDGAKRLFSGFCPKKEALLYAKGLSKKADKLVQILEDLGALKESKKVEDSILSEYRLKDGYTIRLEKLNYLYLVEYQGKDVIGKTRCLSLREGRTQIRKTVRNIEEMEGVSFHIIKE